jgi:hypothetical protein
MQQPINIRSTVFYPKLVLAFKKAYAALSRLHEVFDSNPFEPVTLLAAAKKESPEKATDGSMRQRITP